MASLKQVLKANGFAEKPNGQVDQFFLKVDGKFVGKSYVCLDISSHWGERNARKASFRIGSKRPSIHFDSQDNGCGYKKPTGKQMARFEELVALCKEAALYEAANPEEKAPRKPVPPRPPLTDVEKFDNRVWRWLGEFHVCGFIGKEMQTVLQYKKAGQYILVEDEWNVMAYAPIRLHHLQEAGLPFTLATFEEWLEAKGVKRVAQKRVKRSYSLYD